MRLLRSLLAAAIAIGLAAPARAQDAGPGADAGAPATPAQPGETEPATEPATEPGAAPGEPGGAPRAHLGELAGRTRAALQRARPLTRRSDEIDDVDRRLPEAEEQVARLRDPARVPIARLAQRDLQDLRQEWLRRGTTYREWQGTLGRRAAELEEVRTELVELRRTWAELRRTEPPEDAPSGRYQRIVQSLESVRAADRDVEAQLDAVLAMQERVGELTIVVEDVMEQLRAASEAYRKRLLVRDHPPLWEGLVTPPAAPREGEPAEPSAQERASASLAMVAAQRSGLFVVGAIWIALLAVLALLARRSRAWPPDDETLDVARAIASRPLSTAILIALLATPFAVPHAPIVLYDLAFLILLVPLVRVLWPIAPAHVRPLLAATAVLLFATRLEAMGAELAGLGRVLLLLDSAAAIVLAAGWARRERARDDRTTAWIRAIAIGCAAISAAALIANVLGHVFLAETLMRGTAHGISSGLSLLAAVLVALALADLAIRSELGRRLRTVRDHGPRIHRRIALALGLAAGALWVSTTLDGYDLWGPVAKQIEDLLSREWAIGSFHITLGAIGIAIAILAGTWALARFAKFVLEIEILPRLSLEPGVDGAISGLTRYVLVSIGILLALAALGIDAGQIALVAGALGVGVGFGLQGIVSNVIAGVVLMLERPVRMGDFIEVGPLTGRVDRIGLRSSTVRALDGAEVIVPNEILISREVVNWTLSDRRRRVQVKVGVAYGTDPHRTLEILKGVAASYAGVLGQPAPQALFQGFGESSLDFVLQFWTNDFAEALELESAVGLKVHDALVAAGIEIPFPQRDLHLKSVPEALARR